MARERWPRLALLKIPPFGKTLPFRLLSTPFSSYPGRKSCSLNEDHRRHKSTPTLWAARYLAMNGRRRLLGSFNHGSMANALPQAIGAQLTHRERQVIALSGDGGLAMLMGDLLTLRQHELPVKVVVFRNDALAFVELEMKAAGILDFATGLRNPDFAKMAEAAGLLGLSAETPEQVRPMFDKALAHHGPALVEVHVARQELAMPPSSTCEQAAGFGLFMLRAVLSGRGDEIIDLAKVNVLR